MSQALELQVRESSIRNALIKAHWLLSRQLGFDPVILWHSLLGLPWYCRDLVRFRKTYTGEFKLMPCLHDRYQEAGDIKSEYFWQDVLVAREIYRANPVKHVDIGVGVGSLLGSRGDAILNVGDRFINTPTSYDLLSFGKYQKEDSLIPFSITVKDFRAQYDSVTNAPIDYTLTVSTANPAGSKEEIKIIKVNKPLAYGNTKIYLQANG